MRRNGLWAVALLAALAIALLASGDGLTAQPTAANVRLVAPYRVTVGATAVQLTSSGTVNGGVVIKALCPGETIYVGSSSAVTTATGYPMSNGETLTLTVSNANQIYAIASAAAQSVSVFAYSRY